MTDKALSIVGLSKSYVAGVKVLDNVSLDVGRGDFLALLGPNGAGKSTLISIVCSLIKADAGTVTVSGHDLIRNSFLAKKSIGLMPQEFNFNQFEPIEEILINQAGFYGIASREARRNTDRLLKRFSLDDRARDMPISLSGGMKRRLMLARMLVSDPAVIILDEPTAGVDVEIRHFVWDLLSELNEQGKTVILTTHYLEEAEQLCTTLALINRGRLIYDGSIADVTSLLKTHTYVIRFERGQFSSACAVLSSVDGLKARPGRDGIHVDIDVLADTNLAPVIAKLDQKGVAVLGIRFRRSPLEDVFVNMTSAELAPPPGTPVQAPSP
ncbi:MAG: ABC transporter ATP-binding protein [Gammaproteobacteria bacterium]|nr:ABC transporter ATP-binding protein [Gammaproteobacteria bacterium]